MNNTILGIKLKKVEKEMNELEDLRSKTLINGKEFKEEKKLDAVVSEYYCLVNYTKYQKASEGVLKTKRKKGS